MATYFKQADAAGAGDRALSLPSLTKQIDTKQMRNLATSEPLPHLPWAVKGDMSRELRTKIQLTLLNLNKTQEGKAVLTRIGYDGFTATDDTDYDKHRQIIKEVLGEDF
jgi:phosphonate transport system substrate-binding protein